MERFYTVGQICELLQVKDERTARKIMRLEMEHIEKPRLIVSERSVKAWLERNTLPPENQIRAMLKRKGVKP